MSVDVLKRHIDRKTLQLITPSKVIINDTKSYYFYISLHDSQEISVASRPFHFLSLPIKKMQA